MGFKSDIEIAQEAVVQDIREIAKKLNLTEEDLDLYGKYKAKVDYNLMKRETHYTRHHLDFAVRSECNECANTSW